MYNNLPQKIKIVEVGMRDGLQNEKAFIPTSEKIRMINLLSQTGISHIEITSFVSPKWIPQLADNEEVANNIEKRKGVIYSALVPNIKGLKNAQLVGLEEIAFFLSASESHSMKNINKSIKEAMLTGKGLIKEALAAGLRVRANLSTVFGCPYDGNTDPKLVLEICKELIEEGVYEIAISDTIGVANPKQVTEIINILSNDIDLNKLAVHFHDTRGTGIANALAALQSGITTFDSSFGGLGGCPYAPGASGNIATEDLVYMLENMGIETGIDLDKLVECSLYAQGILGRSLPSKYLQTFSSTCNEVM